MFVGDITSNGIITLGIKDDVEKAFEIMKSNDIRHIPVLDDGELVGIVTETDLRHVLVPSKLEESGDACYFMLTSKLCTVDEIMTRDPVTVSPQYDVEEAARLLQRHKIGGLPVVENGKLIGMVTETDILGVFIEILGAIKYSSRIDVVLGEGPDVFRNVSQIIKEHGAEIISVGMSPQGKEKERVYYFRLDTDDIGPVSDAIQGNGFKVISAVSG